MALNVVGTELAPCSYAPLAGSTPRPELRCRGLNPGDRWGLCAQRWKEAFEAGVAPPVVLEATHERALDVIARAALFAHALQAAGH